MNAVRVIGKRKIEEFGARCPCPDTIRWIADFARRAPRVVPKGIYRYCSHEEADRDTKEWLTNGVVERVQEMAQRRTSP